MKKQVYVKPEIEILKLQSENPMLLTVSGNAGHLEEEDGFNDTRNFTDHVED